MTEAVNHSLFKKLLIGKDARTLGASVTNALRDAIIRGDLAPGEPLGQEFLARAFGVSRVPIRESLKQLATEGLVEVEPHKGAVVAHLSVEELDELYGIIWSLESAAIRVGVPLLTDKDLAEMAAIVEQFKLVSDPVEWYRLSVAFHRIILVASRWQRCVKIVDENRKNIGRYITNNAFFSAHVDEWRQRNVALYEACRRHDIDAALAALDLMRTMSTAQIRAHVIALLDSQENSKT
jgi:DNA-binding GntR family transcriptional regulator